MLEDHPEGYGQHDDPQSISQDTTREPHVDRPALSERARGKRRMSQCSSEANEAEQHNAQLQIQPIEVVEISPRNKFPILSINDMQKQLSKSEEQRSKLAKQLDGVVRALMPSQIDDMRNNSAAWVTSEGKTLTHISEVLVEMCFTEDRLYEALGRGVPNEFNRLIAPVCRAIQKLSELDTPMALNTAIDTARDLNMRVATAVLLFNSVHPEASLPLQGLGMGDTVIEFCIDSLLADLCSRTKLMLNPDTLLNELFTTGRV